jgi:3-methyladenine DNA glycosylase AlkD
MTKKAILQELEARANPVNVAGMARFGITSERTRILGLSMPLLKSLKKQIGTNHSLAMELWESRVYEARVVAFLIADPKRMTKAAMNRWVNEFDNWAICDGVCMYCFRATPFAHEMVGLWAAKKKEFVRRAGFTMIATLAVHDKQAPDELFESYLDVIQRSADDERTAVKKGVNWALRQIGKRNLALHAKAIHTALEIRKQGTPAARWIAADALRELQSAAVLSRLQAKEIKR